MDCMVDIETLDNTPTSAIISVSAVEFDPMDEGYVHTYHANIDWDSALEYGTYSEETIEFWEKQPAETRESLFDPEPIHIRDALQGLADFVKKINTRWIWACSPRFDMVILQHSMQQLGIQLPTKYWDEMDVRTLKMIIPREFMPERKGAHTAMGDCIYQVEVVQLFFRAIMGEE